MSRGYVLPADRILLEHELQCCEVSKEGIEFVLGHALFMKAVHGGKAKNDKIDSHKIAVLLRGGSFPLAYVYPPEMRATAIF